MSWSRRRGWRSYGRKQCGIAVHQAVPELLSPRKFGYDKRLPHYSSLIVSGQMTREVALAALAEPLYDPVELETDLNYFCKKLRITRDEFEQIMAQPSHHHTDFPTWERLQKLAKQAQRALEKIRGRVSYQCLLLIRCVSM